MAPWLLEWTRPRFCLLSRPPKAIPLKTFYLSPEGAPKERELLCGRLIDRPIRPLFPAGFFHEVQVSANVLSSDGKQDPDVMAANATSAALMLSDIPWNGPIGMIRMGRISGNLVVNPSMDELTISDLNLVYACTKDKALMIDVQAREITERDLEAALKLAHVEAVKYIDPQVRLAGKAGKGKKEYKLSMVSKETYEKIRNLAEEPIKTIFTDPAYGKFERGEALENITQDIRKALEEDCDEESLKVLPKTVDKVRKEVIRKRIIDEGFRLDGRRLDEVRPLYCEAGNLPVLHGSSLFSRGDTQVLCTVTLGAPGDAQRLESLVGPSTKRFMLHYSFPPFCINEVGKRGGLNRREVGHGTLAEKALLAVLPPEDDFPYAVRINSEVMASDGSTSMASVCGGSMALMDAGIPLREHVAGISVGLVTDVDPSTGSIIDYRILTDILGLEDHLGDMDFKVSGTRHGITSIQLDIKPAGIPLDIICESLEPARKGRLQILDHMEREINAPRSQDDRNSPRLVILKYNNDAIRRLIGPLGVLKRKIEEETGTRMSVSDGTITMVAKNQSAMEKVQEKIDFIVGREIEIGGTYKGIVTSIKEYGAFVEFNGGQQGLLHISELSHDPVSKISDVLSIGQQVTLRCIGQDVRGNIKLSLKATQPQPRRTSNMTVDFVSSTMETPKIWPPVNDVANEQDKQESAMEDMSLDKNESSDVTSSSSSEILIRSAAECDEVEKSAVLVKNSNSRPKTSSNKRSDKKSKVVAPQKNDRDSPISAFDLFSSKNSSELKTDFKSSFRGNGMDDGNTSANHKSSAEAPINAKNLKLGNEVLAKVYQIRAHGLVLDLGGGLRGMYKFEVGGRKDFEVGEEVQVKCCSFSSKGIPVMSMLETD
ncbi:polyribonucleotide nucleotidyltransferase 2, mitochondrial isoform X2 [Daucus carota subsp. sativus]|uniref:polyribonucleotide nucleotidyltransferase 2, mitochondrial isoform X2 n=1 Tax=Daucus carota subsp. sativus TaxID=79200 RepID=UPI0007EF551A|nr:PREDICTED: polyribonucleotide nucleotidyltransferase 2, mitochondrial isoform X2 [Daucus carota subsp. sativus]